jgi:enterochelin esterase family protein
MNYRILLFSLALAGSLAAQAPAPVPLVSPEVHADRSATFRVRAPNAKQVMLNLQSQERMAMQKDDKGVWSVTTKPLTPDIYPYSFLIDGQTFRDPTNAAGGGSLRGADPSLVHIPGDASTAWDERDVPHGEIHHHTFRSKAIGADMEYYVYTPPSFDPAGRNQYPVLLLLHGMGDAAGAWTTAGGSQIILDNLIAEGKAKPMIVITPHGYGLPPDQLAGGPPAMRSENSRVNFTKSVLEEILPQVEKNYRASADRTQHAIAGLSMGGAQTLYMGLNHPEAFAYIAGMSSALPEFTVGDYPGPHGEPTAVTADVFAKTFPHLDAKINSQLKLLSIACGTDDNLITDNRNLKSWLTTKGVKYASVEIPGAHTWMVWHRNLVTLAPQLFQ